MLRQDLGKLFMTMNQRPETDTQWIGQTFATQREVRRYRR
jgi:hypothetical protein